MYTLAKKKPKKSDFQNAVIPQPVGGFLFSTPEMKARVAYVPFLLYKPINKMEIWIILEHEFQKISNNKYYQHNLHWYFFQYISQDKSYISFLFSGLDSRNGTYASLAFISGVERKNSSTRCGITAFWKSVKKYHFKKKSGVAGGFGSQPRLAKHIFGTKQYRRYTSACTLGEWSALFVICRHHDIPV